MLCSPSLFPSLCNVSVVPLLCVGPSLVQCERKAWRDDRQWREPSIPGIGGVGAQKESQCDGSLPLNTGSSPRSGGMKGVARLRRGAKVLCRHRYAYTDNSMHTQGHPGRLKDRSCWTHPHGDKGRGCRQMHCGAQGGTHPRETKSRETDACTYPRIGSHRDAVTCRGKEESLSPTQKKSLLHACMHTEHLHTAAQLQKTLSLRHTRAHMCPVTKSSSPAVTVAVTQSNTNAATYQYMCTQLSNKYFLDSYSWNSEVL